MSAGASAPEQLVQEVILSTQAYFEVTVEEIAVAKETVRFKLPRGLVAPT
jgi:4-hydroxy-3-methylbut-2-enyl diphosphate reductase